MNLRSSQILFKSSMKRFEKGSTWHPLVVAVIDGEPASCRNSFFLSARIRVYNPPGRPGFRYPARNEAMASRSSQAKSCCTPVARFLRLTLPEILSDSPVIEMNGMALREA